MKPYCRANSEQGDRHNVKALANERASKLATTETIPLLSSRSVSAPKDPFSTESIMPPAAGRCHPSYKVYSATGGIDHEYCRESTAIFVVQQSGSHDAQDDACLSSAANELRDVRHAALRPAFGDGCKQCGSNIQLSARYCGAYRSQHEVDGVRHAPWRHPVVD